MITFSDYQEAALETAVYPNVGNNLTYPVLGLCGEAGEVAEKVKKIYRDKNGFVSEQDKKNLRKELGDVLWYISTICNELKISLTSVAIENIEKLHQRKQNNTLHGNGDNR